MRPEVETRSEIGTLRSRVDDGSVIWFDQVQVGSSKPQCQLVQSEMRVAMDFRPSASIPSVVYEPFTPLLDVGDVVAL